MRQYKEFKKKAKEALTQNKATMDEEERESLQSLVEMLEQFKSSDPTPEEKKKKDQELEQFFVSRKKQYLIVGIVSVLLGLVVLQQFADVVNQDTTHVGRVAKYDSTKLSTHYRRTTIFWQYQDIRNVTDRIPADRMGDDQQPCGASVTKSGDSVGVWPTCLQRCIDRGECALEEDYSLDCFSTCPQISLSGAQDARFFIKRFSDANVQGYFKQQIEIYENKEDVERWSKLCKVDEEGSCTDLSQIRSGAQAEVFEEPCDVALDSSMIVLGLAFVILFFPLYFRSQDYGQMAKDYRKNFQLADLEPSSKPYCKKLVVYCLGFIFLSFFYHLGSVFSTITCRYKQPNLHYFALVIIYVVLGTTFIGSVIFVSDSSRNKEGYKLSRTGIAFICFWNFLFPWYEAVFLLNHTICIIKEEPEGIIARGCTFILVPMVLQILFIIFGILGTATSVRPRMKVFYTLFYYVCFLLSIVILPYLYLFGMNMTVPSYIDDYLTRDRDQYCFQKEYPNWPEDTDVGRWDGKRTTEPTYVTNLDGKRMLQRPNEFDPSVLGSCMPEGIQPWDIWGNCNEVMKRKANYTMSKNPDKKPPSFGFTEELFSCRLCVSTKSCRDSGTGIFKDDSFIASQLTIISVLSFYCSLLGMVFSRSIIQTITKELKDKKKRTEEDYITRLRGTLGSRPSEVRWREEIGIPLQWNVTDEEFYWDQYFGEMYSWKPNNISWRNAIGSCPENRNFDIYGAPEEQEKYRKLVFKKYVQSVMEYTIVDDKKEWTKLQPLRGALTLQQKTKLARMQMKYSAKYNARWDKCRRRKQKKREKLQEAEKMRIRRLNNKRHSRHSAISSVDDGEEKKEMIETV